ncbi:hypothetical protein B7494_g4831 [Chlorociboria aeruginascens]|nr:hypothetical protein B7494_g4831 [Chlorociboria aeruginascens]
MAPMNGLSHKSSILRRLVGERDGGQRDDNDNGNGNGNGSGGGGGRGNGNGNGDGNGHDPKGNDDSRNAHQLDDDNRSKDGNIPPSPTSVLIPQIPAIASSPSISVAVTSTANLTPGVTLISSSIPPPTLSPTATPLSMFATTAAIEPSVTSLVVSTDTSSQPRKGLETQEESSTISQAMSTTKTLRSDSITTTSPSVASALADLTSSQFLPKATTVSHSHHSNHNALSPTAQWLLISAGSIGAFVILCSLVYLFIRMKKTNVQAIYQNREIPREGPRQWYGWRKKIDGTPSDAPPAYSSELYSTLNKSLQPTPGSLGESFAPLSKPETAAGIAVMDTLPKAAVEDSLLQNPALIPLTPAQQPAVKQSATQAFYGKPAIIPVISVAAEQLSPSDYYGTQRTWKTTEVYDPAQRQVNHLSTLSSLSSGFGDAQIRIPEEPARISRAVSRFSWATAARGERDTVYTSTSVESAPRFRTVNSWVAQQTGHLERQAQSDKEVSSMPRIPAHQHNVSEDQAFRQHPGMEIPIARGSRVASSILDKKIGLS